MADNINKIKKVNGKDIVVDWDKIENKPDNLATEEYVDTEPRETIYLTNGMRIESRITDGFSKIYLVSDDHGEALLFDGNTHANFSDEAECAYMDNEGRDLKGCHIEDIGDIDTVDIEIYDGFSMSYGIISESLIVMLPKEYQYIGFISELYFTTPSVFPENYTQFDDKIYFKGDSTQGDGMKSTFVPETDMRYTMVFSFDGNMMVGYVSGVPAPPVSEVTE